MKVFANALVLFTLRMVLTAIYLPIMSRNPLEKSCKHKVLNVLCWSMKVLLALFIHQLLRIKSTVNDTNTVNYYNNNIGFKFSLRIRYFFTST